MSSHSSPMGTDASPPCLAPLVAPSSSGIRTNFTIDGSSYVNNMKIANLPDCSFPAALVVHTLKPHTPPLQAVDATLKEGKSTLRTHAYSRARVIRPGTYSRSILKSAKGQILDCGGCTAVHSLGIDHCHKHDADKYAKGPNKRLRR